MIGLDTNVLVRWVVFDMSSPEQSQRAADAIRSADEDVYVNPVVLAESLWVVERSYRKGRSEQARVLRTLLANPRVILGGRPQVEAALAAFEMGGAGFADHLIGALNAAVGCRTTLTFDKAATKGPYFTGLT